MPLASIIGSVVSGGISYLGAKSAAKAQEKASQRAEGLQREFFGITRGDLEPYRTLGSGAVTSLAQLYGLKTPGNPNGAAFGKDALAAFQRSPDYQFALQEGLSAVEKSRAARGALKSGGTLEELQARGSGIASQNFGNYVSRLLQLAGIGESAASQTASAAANTGGNLSNLALAGGEARASGIVGGANALSETVGNLSNNLSLYRLTNPSRSSYAAQNAANSGNWFT